MDPSMTSPALQEIIALLGCPAAGNPAQYLFERAIEAAELDWRFITFDVAADDVAAAVAGAAALGLRGCLVSGPLREACLRLVATASPSAEFAGSVSLLERRADGLAGHMTDGRGIVEALRAHVDPVGKSVLVIGADAGGRAAALELALAGATRLVICDPDTERSRSLAEALTSVHAADAGVADWQAGVVVPADVGIVVLSSLGGQGAVVSGLRPDLVVADALLAGGLSPVAALAASAGCCVVDGIEIHAAQTAIDFQTLTGLEPDIDMLRDSLEEFLS
jgi:shikimate dehydrogenase